MGRRGKRLKRIYGKRRYRRIFIIATEGKVTEVEYFNGFNNKDTTCHIECITKKGNSPSQVKAKLKEHLKDKTLHKKDEAWLVVDRDQWNEDDLNSLFDWTETGDHYNLALSNPNFEFWILLHFEDGNNISGTTEFKRRLNQHCPNYNKHIDRDKFTEQMKKNAVSRAKRRNTPPCEKWPSTLWNTTVYKLVESILDSNST